jgi:hypothetical protein
VASLIPVSTINPCFFESTLLLKTFYTLHLTDLIRNLLGWIGPYFTQSGMIMWDR